MNNNSIVNDDKKLFNRVKVAATIMCFFMKETHSYLMFLDVKFTKLRI